MPPRFLATVLLLAGLLGCASAPEPEAESASEATRWYVVVAGERVPIATRVVAFDRPGAYDAAQERCWFDPETVLPRSPARGCDTARRYGPRKTRGLRDPVSARIEREGWTRENLRERVDQLVLHYDVCVTSRRCFEVLHDLRGLSVHFLLDADGTLHQTLDLVWRARHAGLANDASVGVEIAHIGAYPEDDERWRPYYRDDGEGGYLLSIPAALGPPEPGLFRCARPGLFRGRINGATRVMPDYTEAQYRALEVLVDFLTREFPRMERRVPRDARGGVRTDALPPEEARRFSGLLGHYHVSKGKSDPGPAFHWERLLR